MTRIGWVLALVACNGDKDGTTTDGECDDAIEVTFTEATGIGGAGTVSFTGVSSGNVHVEHRLSGETDWIADHAVDASAGKAPAYGLRVGSAHQLRLAVDGGLPSCPVDVTTGPPPTGTPAFSPNSQTMSTWATDKACMDGGYVLLSYLGQGKSGAGVIDRDGKYVWAIANDDAMPWGSDGTLIGRVRPGRDGNSVLWNTADEDRVDDIGEIIRVSLDGQDVTRTFTRFAHHDFVELPDGTMSWLGYDFRDVDIPELGGVVPVVTDTIYETPEGSGTGVEPVTIFNTFDDYPGGVFYSGPDMKCTGGFIPDNCEFSHANSLGYLDSEGTYRLNYRWLDAFVKIGRDGTFGWQFGGAANDFTGDANTLFEHSHFSDIWEGGVLMMDNHDSDPPSRLVEFSLNESAMTYERTWFYESDKFESLLGDVRRMPIDGCDNVIVAFSSQGRIVEMTRDGEIVWDYGLPLGNVVARITFIPDLADFGSPAYWKPESR